MKIVLLKSFSAVLRQIEREGGCVTVLDGKAELLGLNKALVMLEFPFSSCIPVWPSQIFYFLLQDAFHSSLKDFLKPLSLGKHQMTKEEGEFKTMLFCVCLLLVLFCFSLIYTDAQKVRSPKFTKEQVNSIYCNVAEGKNMDTSKLRKSYPLNK